MSRRQHVFTADGVEAEPSELTEKDRGLMRRWSFIKGQCPWCMYSGDLWSFKTYLKKESRGRTVSDANCRCPECGANVKRRTLTEIYNMDMKTFGDYFWDRVFHGEYGKVQWALLKKRLNDGFTYTDRQPFWDSYWAHKALSVSGWDESDDDRAYADYVAHREGDAS